ncbi:hypothetical protein M409DRAFT_52047 [Zasmidium cellare ATCC 36951]|uniref:Apple domain-containing protein n=1 Tax=Zasmidium cellare ATCC 36951 TaxID=1080233 RepID=A0A6A6CVH2_ZASCE|nr:uncharacterized protein M409DRAFT_52047 [Zasmidium cellare ATCC 36951]KAF2169506.1 hypothetical protein M409DRAFT_52047 [Zasmidium cellare ATCC 36951]
MTKNTFALAAVLPLLASSAAAQNVKCQTSMGTVSLLVKAPTTTVYNGTVSTGYRYITLTATTTLPTTTDTSTVWPTSTSFRNVWDTLNNNNYKWILANPHAGIEVRAVTTGKQGVQKLLAAAYPTKVVCTKVIPFTSNKTAYTTLPVSPQTIVVTTKRITSLSTLTETSTIIPDRVTSSETDTSTSTVQTTTTTTQTNTETAPTTTTEIAPGQTFWSACSNPNGLNTRNFFGPDFNSGGVGYYAPNVSNNGPGVASNFQIVADGASSAEQCCIACQNLYNCENFIFRQQFKNCFLLNHKGSTCSNPSQHPNFILSKKIPSSGSTLDGYTVGNGNCGYTWSGNSDGSVFRVDGA